MIVDTAGRLQIDERLMEELREVRGLLLRLLLPQGACSTPILPSWMSCLLGGWLMEELQEVSCLFHFTTLRFGTAQHCCSSAGTPTCMRHAGRTCAHPPTQLLPSFTLPSPADPSLLAPSHAQTKAAVNPTDTLLVVDAMTGQEAAGLVKAFNDAGALCAVRTVLCCALRVVLHNTSHVKFLAGWGQTCPRRPASPLFACCSGLCQIDSPLWCSSNLCNYVPHHACPPSTAAVDITGAVLTKMDGDSRGGAALSIKEVRWCLWASQYWLTRFGK